MVKRYVARLLGFCLLVAPGIGSAGQDPLWVASAADPPAATDGELPLAEAQIVLAAAAADRSSWEVPPPSAPLGAATVRDSSANQARHALDSRSISPWGAATAEVTTWPSHNDPTTPMAIRAAGFLALLVFCAAVLTLVSRWLGTNREKRRGAPIQCIASARIAPRSNLAVYAVQHRQYLIAHDQGGIRFLLPLETAFADALEQAEVMTPMHRAELPHESMRDNRRPLPKEELSWKQPPIPRW